LCKTRILPGVGFSTGNSVIRRGTPPSISSPHQQYPIPTTVKSRYSTPTWNPPNDSPLFTMHPTRPVMVASRTPSLRVRHQSEHGLPIAEEQYRRAKAVSYHTSRNSTPASTVKRSQQQVCSSTLLYGYSIVPEREVYIHYARSSFSLQMLPERLYLLLRIIWSNYTRRNAKGTNNRSEPLYKASCFVTKVRPLQSP